MSDDDGNSTRFPKFNGKRGAPASAWKRNLNAYFNHHYWKHGKKTQPSSEIYVVLGDCFKEHTPGDTWYQTNREKIESEGRYRAEVAASQQATADVENAHTQALYQFNKKTAYWEGVIYEYEQHHLQYSILQQDYDDAVAAHEAQLSAQPPLPLDPPVLPDRPPANAVSESLYLSSQQRLASAVPPEKQQAVFQLPSEDMVYTYILRVFWEQFAIAFILPDSAEIKKALALKQTMKGVSQQPAILASQMWTVLQHAVEHRAVTEQAAVTAFLQALDINLRQTMKEFVLSNPPSTTRWQVYVDYAQQRYQSLMAPGPLRLRHRAGHRHRSSPAQDSSAQACSSREGLVFGAPCKCNQVVPIPQVNPPRCK